MYGIYGISGNLCTDCKWEVGAVYDKVDGIYRCSDCGAEIIDYDEEESE